VPDLPSVATQGETVEEALDMARDAIEGYLEIMRDEGWPVTTLRRDAIAVPVHNRDVKPGLLLASSRSPASAARNCASCCRPSPRRAASRGDGPADEHSEKRDESGHPAACRAPTRGRRSHRGQR